MAFDEMLATYIRTALARNEGIEEKKMLGGVGFKRQDACGVRRESLTVRLGDEQGEGTVLEPYLRFR
jgi:hypothetical protein